MREEQGIGEEEEGGGREEGGLLPIIPPTDTEAAVFVATSRPADMAPVPSG